MFFDSIIFIQSFYKSLFHVLSSFQSLYIRVVVRFEKFCTRNVPSNILKSNMLFKIILFILLSHPSLFHVLLSHKSLF